MKLSDLHSINKTYRYSFFETCFVFHLSFEQILTLLEIEIKFEQGITSWSMIFILEDYALLPNCIMKVLIYVQQENKNTKVLMIYEIHISAPKYIYTRQMNESIQIR